MANPEHLRILKQGVEPWNKWRDEHPDVRPNLRDVDLRWAKLTGANLSEAYFGGANLSEADLGRVNLRLANLRRANVSGGHLRGAYFRGADLFGANLSGADLSEVYFLGASLRGADLSGADFTKAQTRGTIFADVDLSAAKGLETIDHRGPSSVGIDTIFKSRGKIPEIFLRGCGLQDWEIELVKVYQPDLATADLTTILHRVSKLRSGAPVGYFSCFISYSTRDQEFADRLYADLQAKGVRCWFAPHDIKGGQKIHEQIDEAIRRYDKLLLILSQHSMSSNWVKTEIANARAREEQEGRQLLFPITLAPFEEVRNWKQFDADTGVDSAREIREYFIPDFSNWKDHDSYQTAFQRLVSGASVGPGQAKESPPCIR